MLIDTSYVTVRVTPDGRLNRKDAALYLGVSSKTLAEWARCGRGPPYFKVGSRCFYFVNDLKTHIRSVI